MLLSSCSAIITNSQVDLKSLISYLSVFMFFFDKFLIILRKYVVLIVVSFIHIFYNVNLNKF